MTRSVVVTGLGVVARDVMGIQDLRRILAQGGSDPDCPPQFDTQKFRAKLAYAADPKASERTLRQIIRDDRAGLIKAVSDTEIDCAAHGILAAHQAIVQAGLDADTLHHAGCSTATTSGGMMDAYTDALDGDCPVHGRHDLVSPGSAAVVLQRVFGLTGPLCSFSCACVSSLGALSYAYARVRRGDAPIMLVGGTDRMREADFAGFNALRAMDRDSCRPFDKTRKGMMIGDGAAMLVIEDEAHARARGATPLARLVGMGLATDSHHITSPDSQGLIRAMRQALTEANRAPGEIGYVNCHGTGTPLNDTVEADALAAVFPDLTTRPIISSTKGTTGHLLGSAGAIETVVTILALQAQEAPVMSTTIDPEDIPFALPLAGTSRALASGVAMKNSLGFGGLNGSLILEHLDTGEI